MSCLFPNSFHFNAFIILCSEMKFMNKFWNFVKVSKPPKNSRTNEEELRQGQVKILKELVTLSPRWTHYTYTSQDVNNIDGTCRHLDQCGSSWWPQQKMGHYHHQNARTTAAQEFCTQVWLFLLRRFWQGASEHVVGGPAWPDWPCVARAACDNRQSSPQSSNLQQIQTRTTKITKAMCIKEPKMNLKIMWPSRGSWVTTEFVSRTIKIS